MLGFEVIHALWSKFMRKLGAKVMESGLKVLVPFISSIDDVNKMNHFVF